MVAIFQHKFNDFSLKHTNLKYLLLPNDPYSKITSYPRSLSNKHFFTRQSKHAHAYSRRGQALHCRWPTGRKKVHGYMDAQNVKMCGGLSYLKNIFTLVSTRPGVGS